MLQKDNILFTKNQTYFRYPELGSYGVCRAIISIFLRLESSMPPRSINFKVSEVFKVKFGTEFQWTLFPPIFGFTSDFKGKYDAAFFFFRHFFWPTHVIENMCHSTDTKCQLCQQKWTVFDTRLKHSLVTKIDSESQNSETLSEMDSKFLRFAMLYFVPFFFFCRFLCLDAFLWSV